MRIFFQKRVDFIVCIVYYKYMGNTSYSCVGFLFISDVCAGRVLLRKRALPAKTHKNETN